MKRRGRFLGCYTFALSVAALGFGIIHISADLLGVLSQLGSTHFQPTGLITNGLVAITDVIVFIALGWLIACGPAGLVYDRLRATDWDRFPTYVVFGLLFGLMALPLCAWIAYVPFKEEDDPAYLDRCVEFAAPMLGAGLAGGLAFWRVCRGRNQRPSIANLFS